MTLRDSVKQGSMTRLGKARVVSVPMEGPLRPLRPARRSASDCLAQRQAHLRVSADEGRDHFRQARSGACVCVVAMVSLPRLRAVKSSFRLRRFSTSIRMRWATAITSRPRFGQADDAIALAREISKPSSASIQLQLLADARLRSVQRFRGGGV